MITTGLSKVQSLWFCIRCIITDGVVSMNGRQRNAIGIAVSLGLHLLIAVLLFAQWSNGMAAGGVMGSGMGRELGEGIEVSLMPATPEVLSVEPVEMLTRPDVEAPETKIETLPVETSEFSSEDAVQTEPTKDQKEMLSEKTPSLQQASGAAGLGQSVSAGEGGSALWDAIAPCWNRLMTKDTVPVTLELSFDGAGLLAQTPVIKREEGVAVSAHQTQSEFLALMALSECGGYPIAKGQANVIVAFPVPGQAPGKNDNLR